MRRLLLGGAAVLLLVAAAAGPAGAFRLAARSNSNPLFRDALVCTDGISFDIGTEDSFSPDNDTRMFPPDTLPEPAIVTERLFITTGPDNISPNPAFDLPDLPGKVLAGAFEADAIANNDPFWDGAQARGFDYDTTGLRLWIRHHTVAWEEPLAPGTVLNVYLTDDGGSEGSVEAITVTDCELFAVEVSPCASEDAIRGTSGNDVIMGTPGDDIICAFGGNDIVDGMGGNDLIFGGDGRDKLLGGDDDDRIFGGPGRDLIKGQAGDDRLHGNGDDDVVFGGTGDDRMFGNDGNDRLIGNRGDDRLFGNADDDRLVGGIGVDFLNGGSGTNVEIQ